MLVPSWVPNAIFYQIFPDRFANGDTSNDPSNVQAWGSPPTLWGFQGGDFAGVIEHFDYLLDLGVNALYFNPIFQSTSNHRYNTTDYYRIDSKLGTMEDFHALLDLAHGKGVKVILDGVFNHCGRGFFAFNDVLENREHSAYLNWFHINGLPLDAYDGGQAQQYLGWWDLKSLPKFNTDNQEVRSYLLDVARFWTQQGIDGWRLDVPNEIDDDTFWAEFRTVVKDVNPDAYIVGEIWTPDPRWVGPHHFDGLMLYPLRTALVDLLIEKTLSPGDFCKQVASIRSAFPPEHNQGHLLLIGSHDTRRLSTVAGNAQIAWLMFFFIFGYPGAPIIFYGDEIGLEGGKDPDCRRAFPWAEDRWDQDLRLRVKKLIGLRHHFVALRQGNFEICAHDDQTGLIVTRRQTEAQTIWQIINASAQSQTFRLGLSDWGLVNSQAVRGLLYDQVYPVEDGVVELKLAAYEGEFLLEL